MIRSFADRETEVIWQGQRSRRLPQNIQRSAMRKLAMIEAAETVEELRNPPGNRLERLAGGRQNQWSIRINAQWRICFIWHGEGAEDAEITDYH